MHTVLPTHAHLSAGQDSLAGASFGEQPANPTALKPRSLIYLWAPGVPRGHADRVLARVERTTMDVILAVDLGSRCPGKYEVGTAYPARLRWTWELAAGPEGPLDAGEVEFIDRGEMSREERRQLLLGDQGAMLTIHLADQTSVSGVVTKIVYDGPDPVWLFVASLPDSIKAWIIKVQVEKVTQIKQLVRG